MLKTQNRFKTLPEKKWLEIKADIKMLLHAARDCMRNRHEKDGYDSKNVRFVAWDGYGGEAFGILRALALLGYGTIRGAVNMPEERTNLKWWLSEIENEVLAEEGYGGDNKCDYCFQRYGKDAVRTYTPIGTNGRTGDERR